MGKLLLVGVCVSVALAFGGVLIPFYHYPAYNDAKVSRLVSLKQRYPNVELFVIINPDNGYVKKRLYNFAFAIRRLHQAGIHPLGYVHTDYGKRPVKEIEANIEAWKRIYGKWGIEGIFFDEVNGTKELLEYYKPLASYARGKFRYVVLNPGTSIAPEFETLADIIVTNESNTTRHYCELNTSKNALLLHSTKDFNLSQEVFGRYDFIYVTPQKMPNPWKELSPYLEELIKRVAERKKEGCFN